ncbi:MAG: rhodanese-like domain-containing protein [Gammaproteobacteria bacterium]
MFIEKVKSEGLAHLSYVIGSEGEAAVIDPRRDCDVYSELAARNECRITRIFETHRNEDILSGSAVLAQRTNATVHHGPDAAGKVRFARTTREGDEYRIGNILLRVLQTPGHTDDSLSFALVDTDAGPDVFGVFTGDALFIGDVGRTDFYPDRAREVAGLLYDSLQKLLALGDQAVVWPAHGAGSVCGSGMADREVSTIGHERLHNPRLQISDREAFIEAKLAEHHEQPPYFRYMEEMNLRGAAAIPNSLVPTPLSATMLEAMREEVTVVDVRSASAYLGAHLENSLALPEDTISSFAGWLLEPDEALVLIADDAAQSRRAARYLLRIGYDGIRGYLAPSLTAWAAGGGEFGSLPAADAKAIKRRIDRDDDDWILLDVRGEDEVKAAMIPGARHLYLGRLPGAVAELDRDAAYTVMCGSGTRATIAASVLRRAGFTRVDLFLGSMGAWQKAGLPTEEGD